MKIQQKKHKSGLVKTYAFAKNATILFNNKVTTMTQSHTPNWESKSLSPSGTTTRTTTYYILSHNFQCVYVCVMACQEEELQHQRQRQRQQQQKTVKQLDKDADKKISVECKWCCPEEHHFTQQKFLLCGQFSTKLAPSTNELLLKKPLPQ